MSPKFIEDFFRPFSMEQTFFAASIARRMEEYGVSTEDIISAIDTLVEQRRKDDVLIRAEGEAYAEQMERIHTDNRLACPKCKSRLRLSPVNVSKCTNIGGGYRTSILCMNEDCRYNELSKKTVRELTKL